MRTDRTISQSWHRHSPLFLLLVITLAALALRLLALSWHAPHPISGDEEVFFEQARTFVQGHGYHDFEFMRGPLYPLFLAVIFRLFGAEISTARLVQALLSTVTVPLIYLWTRGRHGTRAGLIAAALGALYFGFAVQATFLLTETLFLLLFALGMVLLEWRTARELFPLGPPGGTEHSPSGHRPAWLPLAGGIVFGLATLTRSIGLPLVLLAAVGCALIPRPGPGRGTAPEGESGTGTPSRPIRRVWVRLRPAVLVLAGAAIVILPWTVRNTLVHHAFILVDTTGTTNLWMDNAPELGRDRVKAELLRYPEGERQPLAVREGLRAIATQPAWFLDKCWQEVKKFFSLEYFDDFLARPAIWYTPGEVWARVLLGDELYLLLMAAGLIGLAGSRTRWKALDLLWLAYVPATTTLFHVELRYRLPFLLALIPYAALGLAHPVRTTALLRKRPLRAVLAGLALLALTGTLLAHASYPALGLQVASKRLHLVLGEWALQRGDAREAAVQARSAIAAYPESSEARVLWARALRAEGYDVEAEAALRQAIDYRSGHPHPHLLLGDLLRAQGRLEEALPELAYERNSLEDLQRWAWESFAQDVPGDLDMGSGLELGSVLGWHLPERNGEGTTFRWTDERVQFRLAAPAGSGPGRLTLRLAAGRPADLPLPTIEVWLEGEQLARFPIENGWHTYAVEIGELSPGTTPCFELRAGTFHPHQVDPHLDDNRPLGVMVDWIRLSR